MEECITKTVEEGGSGSVLHGSDLAQSFAVLKAPYYRGYQGACLLVA
jgi:hypothetical protein